jgi:propanol-preferring alcohol dehydrogenase
VVATVFTEKLENINDVFARLREGRIEGRVVLDLEAWSHLRPPISAKRVE